MSLHSLQIKEAFVKAKRAKRNNTSRSKELVKAYYAQAASDLGLMDSLNGLVYGGAVNPMIIMQLHQKNFFGLCRLKEADQKKPKIQENHLVLENLVVLILHYFCQIMMKHHQDNVNVINKFDVDYCSVGDSFDDDAVDYHNVGDTFDDGVSPPLPQLHFGSSSTSTQNTTQPPTQPAAFQADFGSMASSTGAPLPVPPPAPPAPVFQADFGNLQPFQANFSQTPSVNQVQPQQQQHSFQANFDQASTMNQSKSNQQGQWQQSFAYFDKTLVGNTMPTSGTMGKQGSNNENFGQFPQQMQQRQNNNLQSGQPGFANFSSAHQQQGLIPQQKDQKSNIQNDNQLSTNDFNAMQQWQGQFTQQIPH